MIRIHDYERLLEMGYTPYPGKRAIVELNALERFLLGHQAEEERQRWERMIRLIVFFMGWFGGYAVAAAFSNIKI